MTSNNKGYSSIEFILVLALLLLFTMGSLVLTKTGSELYKRMTDYKDTQTDLRIASSYIMNKLRQSDIHGNIRVEAMGGGRKAIALTEQISDRTYETWIFSDGTYLREAIIPKGKKPSVKESFEIVGLAGLNPEFTDNSTISVELVDSNNNDVRMVYNVKSRN
jgi:hypothetical protein